MIKCSMSENILIFIYLADFAPLSFKLYSEMHVKIKYTYAVRQIK